MLENEDIQHILLTRTPALTGRYEFLSFRNAVGGRAWLSAIREKAQSAAEVMASVEKDKRWVTVAFTWNGLRALGVDEGSLATFPEEFKQGINPPVESDYVSSVGVLEFLHVPGPPITSECCLKDLDYNGVPTDLVAGCRQDRRMKDNVLIEGGYRSRRIASFQCSRQDSLRHSGETPRFAGKSDLRCHLVESWLL